MWVLCFNSSQVGYKLHTTNALPSNSSPVSIPHRLATNSVLSSNNLIASTSFNSSQVGYKHAGKHTCAPSNRTVSIPHRLATNCNGPYRASSSTGFQFLIGWLQTFLRKYAKPNELSFNSSQVGYKPIIDAIDRVLFFEFQFLIGWLQTRPAQRTRQITCNWFQFLIGWLQTLKEDFPDDLEAMFQFLIGWLQTRNQNTSQAIRNSFNSSQVGYKPSTSTAWSMLFPGFNSSQVGYKPDSNQIGIVSYDMFQFLIGWLQTEKVVLPFFLCPCFNSSQVGYKPVVSCNESPTLCGFNSSQVGYKLKKLCTGYSFA